MQTCRTVQCLKQFSCPTYLKYLVTEYGKNSTNIGVLTETMFTKIAIYSLELLPSSPSALLRDKNILTKVVRSQIRKKRAKIPFFFLLVARVSFFENPTCYIYKVHEMLNMVIFLEFHLKRISNRGGETA